MPRTVLVRYDFLVISYGYLVVSTSKSSDGVPVVYRTREMHGYTGTRFQNGYFCRFIRIRRDFIEID